jgi:hypothetical protein
VFLQLLRKQGDGCFRIIADVIHTCISLTMRSMSPASMPSYRLRQAEICRSLNQNNSIRKSKGNTDLDDLRLPQYAEQVLRSLEAPLTALLPFSIASFSSADYERDLVLYALSDDQFTMFQAIYLLAYVQTKFLSVEVRPGPEHILLSFFISQL